MLHYSRLQLLLLKCMDTPRQRVTCFTKEGMGKDWAVSLHHNNYTGGSTFRPYNRKCSFHTVIRP